MAQATEISTESHRRIARVVLNVSILSLVMLSAVVYPLVSEIDPWHGHVVVGTANPSDRMLALLGHRHAINVPHAHGVGGPADQSVVLSFAERVMLSTLADFASATALIPGHSIPILTIFLLLPLTFFALPIVAKTGHAPPNPPPR